MEVNQFLSVQENREVVRAISLKAVSTLAPAETQTSELFVDPWLDMVAREETISAKAKNTAMGLGSLGDLALLVVAPMVAQLLLQLLYKLDINNLKDLRNWVQQQKARPNLVTIQAIKPADIAILRQILVDRFSFSEMRDICFDLEIDDENLPGESKGDLAREMIRYLERRGRVAELWEMIKELRPDTAAVLKADLPPSSASSSILVEITDGAINRFVVDTKYMANEKQFLEVVGVVDKALQDYLRHNL